MRAAVSTEIADPAELHRQVLASPEMVGADLALAVSRKTARLEPGGRGRKKYRVAAVDYGMKRNIVRLLQAGSCRVTVFPATASDEEILESKPDGIFLSNGPGDPAALPGPVRTIQKLAVDRQADLRHLPRPPAARPRVRRQYVQAEVRPPGRQSPGPGHPGRPRRHHVAEPRLRGRRLGAAGRARGDAQEPERRDARGLPPPDAPDPGRAVPPGGGARAARRQRPLQRFPRGDGPVEVVKSLALQVAVRYLRSRPSRLISSVSLLSIAGIALGVAALVVAMGLLSGYRAEIREKLIGANAEVVVFPMTAGGEADPAAARGAPREGAARARDRARDLPDRRGRLGRDARWNGCGPQGDRRGGGARGVRARPLHSGRRARDHARRSRTRPPPWRSATSSRASSTRRRAT